MSKGENGHEKGDEVCICGVVEQHHDVMMQSTERQPTKYSIPLLFLTTCQIIKHSK